MHSPNEATAAVRPAGIDIEVAGIELLFRTVRINDLTPTGLQIARAAGARPPDQAAVLVQLENGDLDLVRLDEVLDLRNSTRRFIVKVTDHVSFFVVDGQRYEWPGGIISGAVIRRIGQVSDEFTLVQQLVDIPDREVKPEELIDLDQPGVETFTSVLRPQSYHFFVSGVRFDTPHRSLSGAQIKAMVPDWDQTHDLVLEGTGDEPDRTIEDCESVDFDTKHGVRRFSSVPKANFG
jgi:hypothetical protein